MVVVQVVNSLSSRSESDVLVRAFTLRYLCLNLLFLARHVPRVANGITDALSHKQMEQFHQLAPEANPLLAHLPPEIWQLGW